MGGQTRESATGGSIVRNSFGPGASGVENNRGSVRLSYERQTFAQDNSQVKYDSSQSSK